MTTLDYIGKGIKWPVEVSGGRTIQVSGHTLVQQSILRILTTPKGKIIFNPEYGSRIHELHFQPNDDILKNLLYLFIEEAIEEWEKRCKFVGVEFLTTEDKIECVISVRVLNKNEVFSFIFPFYKTLIY